jgi:phenylpropionate dioxygenase-like ring-hydroxylating dioxygenase large terminal subunit
MDENVATSPVAKPASPATFAEAHRVHRRIYADPAIFALERKRIFARAWIYVAHDSQLRQPGDFVAADLAGRPILVVRQDDGRLLAVHNRCAHRGALITTHPAGSVRAFTCAYHGWAYGLDGALRSLPQPEDYAGTKVAAGSADFALLRVPRVASHRGFVFASLAASGPDLASFLGAAAVNLDVMVDRAPAGEIELAGGTFRAIQRSNWKIYLENLHDGLHAHPTHRSSIRAARSILPLPHSPLARLQAEAIAANGQTPQAMAKLAVQCHPYGHSDMSAFRESRPATPEQAEYEAALAARVGAAEAERILGIDRHNAAIYPSLALQPSFMQLRVVVPLAADRTRVDVHLFRLKGASDAMNRRFVAFATAIHSPASLVRADDLENYERIHHGLTAGGGDWVNFERRVTAEAEPVGRSNAVSERFIRNQYAAWRQYMAEGGDAG